MRTEEALGLIRGLIERVIVHAKDEGFEIELEGEIASMVGVALPSDTRAEKTAPSNKAAFRRPVLDECSRVR
jgi:hypothetical protein